MQKLRNSCVSATTEDGKKKKRTLTFQQNRIATEQRYKKDEMRGEKGLQQHDKRQ